MTIEPKYPSLGLPDGLTESDYHDWQKWDPERWRWEFLRRRKDILRLYQELAFQEQRTKTGSDFFHPKTIWLPEFRNRSYWLSPAKSASTGYGRLPNPLYSFHDLDDFGLENFVNRTLVPWHLQSQANPCEIIGYGGQVAIVFDPNRPIDKQIAGLKEYLLSRRYHGHDPDLQRHHPSKWLTYLRMLDARAAKISWRVCADKVLSRHSGQLQYTAGTIDSARAVFTQATTLQIGM